MNRLEVSTYTLHRLTLEDALSKLVDQGWSQIEIMGEDAGYVLYQWRTERLRALAGALHDKGVRLNLHMPVAAFNPADPACQKEAWTVWRRTLDLIDIFDFDYVLMHPGRAAAHASGLDSLGRFLREALPQLPASCRLALENTMFHEARDEVGTSVEDLLQLVRAAGDPRVGIMFDIGHAFVAQGERLAQQFELAQPYLIGCHLNDNHGEHDEHLALGDGAIAYEPVLKAWQVHPDWWMNLELDRLELAEKTAAVIAPFAPVGGDDVSA
ncbi:MAG: sugar phosphate isomerase/epimerase family protein [Sporolactobacillus sp.]